MILANVCLEMAPAKEEEITGTIGNKGYCAVLGGPCERWEDCETTDKAHRGKMCPSDTEAWSGFKCFAGICKASGVVQPSQSGCDCLLGCVPWDSRGDFECRNNVCEREACAACGARMNGLSCCPPGIMSRDGTHCECLEITRGCKDVTQGCPNPNHDCCDDGKCRSKC
jgi:hypothetical protein